MSEYIDAKFIPIPLESLKSFTQKELLDRISMTRFTIVELETLRNSGLTQLAATINRKDAIALKKKADFLGGPDKAIRELKLQILQIETQIQLDHCINRR